MEGWHSTAAGRVWSRESIALILHHHMDISEERFFNMDLEEFNKRQRDASYTHGISWDPWQLLCVSRTWRAVGEPLLYHTVVVRSQAQAYTLMDAFRGNSALANYVRRLRLEQSFGLAGAQILHFVAATAVDFWFNIADLPRDIIFIQPQGIALSWINPRRVALHDELVPPTHDRPSLSCEYVAGAIRRWSQLRHCTYTFRRGADEYTSAIACALAASATLEVLDVSGDCVLPHPLLYLATTPSTLRKVTLHHAVSPDLATWFSSRLPLVVVDCRAPLSARPSFTRHFPGEIVDMIIGFALLAPLAALPDHRLARRWYAQPLASHLLVVSAQFKEFTLAHLCRRPYFNDATKVAQFTSVMRRRDDLIQRVVAVDLAFGRDFSNGYYGGDRGRDGSDMISLNYLFTTMRNLRRISISAGSGDGYISLASWVLDTLGDLEHLEELSGISFGGSYGDTSPICSSALARLATLRKLVNSRWLVPLRLHESAPWTSVFGNLCTLEIRHIGDLMQHSLWVHLEAMELPLLRSFGYPALDMSRAGGFLQKHGAKLTSLAFREYTSTSTEQDSSLADWCPHLATIEFWARIDLTIDHPGVLRVVVNTALLSDMTVWLAESVDPETGEVFSLPLANLREVQHRALDDWKSPLWQKLSDQLRDKNIVLLTRSGEAWRPRLARPQADRDAQYGNMVQNTEHPRRVVAHTAAYMYDDDESMSDDGSDVDYGY